MKKEIKGFILGVLTTLILTAGSSLAYSQFKTIEVVENNVTIYANDNLITVPNFTYKDTTYVPLRAVLEKMDGTIFYNGNTKCVYAYNNFHKIDYPVEYNNSFYTTISEYGFDNNGFYSVVSRYSDVLLFDDMNGITTFTHNSGIRLSDNTSSSTSSIGTSSSSSFLQGRFPWHLYSNNGQVYLGKLVTNKYDTNGIWNEYGNYGSKYSLTSIWNEYCDYGSKYNNNSAFNDYAQNPPKIVDADGNVIGYLTTNKYHKDAVTIQKLYSILKDNYQ